MRRWNARTRAVVATSLVAANLAVFVLTTLDGGLDGRGGGLQGRLALWGPAVGSGEWHRLVSSAFLHYGILHVAFNMILLYRFGEMLEPVLGRVRFAVLYLAALLSGSLGVVLVEPMALTGGASGAVFGLVGAAAVGLRRHGVGLRESGIGGLLAVNLLITFLVPGISIGGHVGGLVGGAAVGAAMFRLERSTGAGVALGLLAAAAAAVVAVTVVR